MVTISASNFQRTTFHVHIWDCTFLIKYQYDVYDHKKNERELQVHTEEMNYFHI